MRTSNEWGEAIPEPGAAFTNRRVNPANLALETRRRESRLMSKRELKRAVARRDHLYKALGAVGFWPAFEQFQQLMAHHRNVTDALKGAVNGQREPLEHDLSETAKEIHRLRAAHAGHIEAYKEWRALCDRLNEHTYAVQRADYDRRLNEELAQEATHFEAILIDTWARLGYKHDLLHRNKRIVHKVAFDRIEITGDAIWYKIATTRKTLGKNFKSVLPYGVRVRDLISEETLYELSLATQRQVTCSTKNNGAWVKVNRLDSVDGLLTYVTIEQVMKHYPESDRPFLPIPMGVEAGRKISWVQLAKFPHMLVGGSSGGGKSNIINVIICTLISKHTAADMQLVLVDLKEGLEFQAYEKIPQLLMPVVKTIEDAAKVMLQLEQLRAQRGMALAEARVKDIDEYNDVMARRGQPPMPRVIVIFDEYAAIENPFYKDHAKSIQASVMQLTNKARAAGIHLILCTQRPSVDVVPGHIKDNMAFRISGVMPTQAASMTILGVGDAANLPLHIKGRMIAMAGAEKWQVQAPHVRPGDLEAAIKIAMTTAAKTMTEDAPKVALPEAKGSLGFGEDDLLILVMDSYGGHMKYIDLWEQLKDTGIISQGELRALIKVVKEYKTFDYEGRTYRWSRQPGGSMKALIVEHNQDAAEDEEDKDGEIIENRQSAGGRGRSDIVELS